MINCMQYEQTNTQNVFVTQIRFSVSLVDEKTSIFTNINKNLHNFSSTQVFIISW